MSQNLPPNNNSAQKDDEFEVSFDFLDADEIDATPQKNVGDELDDLSFLDNLDDNTGISEPPPPAKQEEDEGFDDFLSSLDDAPVDNAKPTKSDLDDEPPMVAPVAPAPTPKKDKENAAKPKKSLFSFGKKSGDKKPDDKKAADKKASADKPKKSLFSFGKKSGDKKPDDKKAADKKASVDKKAPADKPKKSAFGMGKKTDDKPKKSGGFLGFGKKTPDATKTTPTKPAGEKPAKKPLFGFGKKTADATKVAKPIEKPIKPTATEKAAKAGKAPTNKKTIWLAVAALLAVALLFAAWFMMNSEEPAPVPPVEPPKPAAPTVQTPPAPAPMPTAPVEGTMTTAPTTPAGQPSEQSVVIGQPMPAGQSSDVATATAGAAQPNTALVTGSPAIDADAIVKAEVPKDPALIKEEIDRLNDKNGQFQEQAKIIDEQLGKLEELTVAKEEKIALLEAQIAQLEAQKSK